MTGIRGGAPAVLVAMMAVAVASCDVWSPPAGKSTAEVPGQSAVDGKGGAPDSSADSSAAPALALEGEGLRVVQRPSGRTAPVSFGTDESRVLDVLERAGWGPPAERGRNAECPAGPLEHRAWPDGLTLRFQDAAFVGWSIDFRGDAELTTMSGLGIGSTRAELEAAYATEVAETTLGVEFSAGDLHGILDGEGPDAQVTHLWAGVSCVFR